MVHLKGKHNHVADALSRNPTPSSTEVAEEDVSITNQLVSAVQLGIAYDDLASAADDSSDLQLLKNFKKYKWTKQEINNNTLWC